MVIIHKHGLALIQVCTERKFSQWFNSKWAYSLW